ncbi:MAG: trigger factor [Anaerolineales bacterium]|nr:trigger factor [Anaerolineales bacterium]
MNIEKQYQDDHSVKLIVDVDATAMDDYKKRAASKISRNGKISGFRPGKAPYHIVVRNYGEAAILEEAINLFIDAEYSNILDEAGIKPGASGSLENVESMDPPKLIFSVPLEAEVDLGDYASVRLPYEWTAPDPKEADKEIEDLRQMYASTETVERAAETGDYILLDVASETPELNRAGFATFIRKEERDTEWPYNGFANELIGLKAGESKTIKHAFPEDFELEELRGKEAEMTATIKTVRGVILPDLDDDFAKLTQMGETVDELKEEMKKSVEARSKDQYDDKYFVDLIEKIKEGATIKYHQHALEHESEHVIQDLSQRLAQQGMDFDLYLKTRNLTREQFIEQEAAPVAKKRLERGLILDEIVKREEIQINDDELNAEYYSLVNSLSMQGMDFSKIRGGKKGQQELSQAIAMDAMSRAMTRKALDMLKTIAIGEYKPLEERKAEAEKAAAEAKAEEESAPAAQVAESESGEEKTEE